LLGIEACYDINDRICQRNSACDDEQLKKLYKKAKIKLDFCTDGELEWITAEKEEKKAAFKKE